MTKVSVRTARKWVRRHRGEGELGLLDRSSRPHSSPTATPEQRVQLIALLRRSSSILHPTRASRAGPAPCDGSSTTLQVENRTLTCCSSLALRELYPSESSAPWVLRIVTGVLVPQPDTHHRTPTWKRWKGTGEDIADVGRRAVSVIAEFREGQPPVWIELELADRRLQFESFDPFLETFRAEELKTGKFKQLSMGVNTSSPPGAAQLHLSVGADEFAAVRLHVEGTNRSAVDAVAAQVTEVLDAGKRTPDVPIRQLRRRVSLGAALIGALVAAGLFFLIGPSDKWWVIALSSLTALGFAAGIWYLAGKVAVRLAPWLELLNPGEQSRWEKFKAQSLSNGERVVWLVVGAIIAWGVSKF